VTDGLASNLSAAILNSDDPAMIRDGAPSVPDFDRFSIGGLARQSGAADSIGGAALCLRRCLRGRSRAGGAAAQQGEDADLARYLFIAKGCLRPGNRETFDDFSAWVDAQDLKSVPALYNLGSIWAGWIQGSSSDFTAIAQLGRVKALIKRVADLDPEHANGGAFLYMGVFETLLPPAMGGRPELGRQHFERALAISNERNLIVKVMLADQYARLMFDRELHDQLLQEVLAADVQAPGLTLMNTVAQERAQLLLDSADDYF
jgi:hypothetical protein